jgi:hypothetical protein
VLGVKQRQRKMEKDKSQWVYADFNGLLADDLLCLSHGDTVRKRSGEVIGLKPGMNLTAYEDDVDKNNQTDDLFATGTVEPSPDFAQCSGSKWCLRIDRAGIRHESDLYA